MSETLSEPLSAPLATSATEALAENPPAAQAPAESRAPIRSVISPGRYVQGVGALERLAEYLEPIGDKPLLLADDQVWGFVGPAIEASLAAGGLTVQREKFNGVPTAAEVNRLVTVIQDSGANVIVGVGGGSTIDAAKASGFAGWA